MNNENENPHELVQQWIEQCVIDLSLCPFASAPYRAGLVRIAICTECATDGFLQLIDSELTKLDKDMNGNVETTLVVALHALPDFLDFNDFLSQAEALLKVDDRQSRVQIASFHPQYQFAGVAASDSGNYTNRAPYPIVQWLRADTVTKAVEATDTLSIPDKNIERLQSMSAVQLSALFPWSVET